MADSIREKIVADIATTVAGITTDNGYNTNVASVQRYDMRGSELNSCPAILVGAGAEALSDAGNGQIEHILMITIDVFLRQTAADANSTDELINAAIADVQKILAVDVTRGGNARDTKTVEVEPFEFDDGGPVAGASITASVLYTTTIGDPYTAA